MINEEVLKRSEQKERVYFYEHLMRKEGLKNLILTRRCDAKRETASYAI